MNVKKLKSAIGIVVTWALSFMLMAGFYIQCIFLPFFRGRSIKYGASCW